MGSIVTIISPAPNSPPVSQHLTTLATAKVEMGVTGTADDNKILTHIAQASNQIAAACNRTFGRETVEERFLDVMFNRFLILRRRPVIEILSLLENDSELDASEYFVDSESGMLYRKTPIFTSAWGNGVIVTYDAGYNLLDYLPEALERACLILVKQYFTAPADPTLRGEDIPGVASYSYGFGSAGQNGSNLPSEVVALIAPFRDFAVA